jgi:hypothetical protein
MARTKVPPQEATHEEVFNKTFLFDHAEAFAQVAGMMSILRDEMPFRSSLHQVAVITGIMAANARGERVTLTDLRSQSPKSAANINKSYQIFLAPSPKDPEALGWISVLPDVNDGRKKYLILTPKGREIALKLANGEGV